MNLSGKKNNQHLLIELMAEEFEAADSPAINSVHYTICDRVRDEAHSLEYAHGKDFRPAREARVIERYYQRIVEE